MQKHRRNTGDDADHDSPEDATLRYLNMFEHHTADFRRHVAGLSHWKSVLPSSTFLPGTHWSPEEKGVFFHGLALYSRLRPDLIADHINISLASSSKTAPPPRKTPADVSIYVSLLEYASRDKGLPDGMSSEEFRARSIPSARVLSFDWTSNEEMWANRLMIEHTSADKREIEKARKQTAKEFACTSADADVVSVGNTINATSVDASEAVAVQPMELPAVTFDYKINSKSEKTLKRNRTVLENQGNLDSVSVHSSDAEPDDAEDNHSPPRKKRALEDSWITQDFLREIDSARADLLDELILRAHDSTRAGKVDEKIVGAIMKPQSRLPSEYWNSDDGDESRKSKTKRSPAENSAIRIGALLMTAKRAGISLEELQQEGMDLFNHRHLHKMAS